MSLFSRPESLMIMAVISAGIDSRIDTDKGLASPWVDEGVVSEYALRLSL